MQPYQERVVAEKKELDERLAKLKTFLMGAIFQGLTTDEKLRLSKQAKLMKEYSDMLGERIAAFTDGA